MGQGTFGRIRFENDFTAPPLTAADLVPLAAANNLGGGISLIGVNEGSITLTVDEPGGIIDITTDVGDNDNQALVAGTFKPADGGFWMECRFKIPDSVATTRAAVFVGFSETLALDTPVMPAETATTTTTYNGTGGMAGFVFDSDASTIAWRFVAGDGGAALATINKEGPGGTVGGAIGITAAATITADKWYVARVEVNQDGYARGYFGDIDTDEEQRFVGRNTAALGTTDMFHAVALIENRSGANERLEVDYFGGEAWRDWTP